MTEDESAGGFASPVITVVSSLVVVLGLFATLIWLTRRFGGGAVRAGAMPSDVIQNLGSTAWTRKHASRCFAAAVASWSLRKRPAAFTPCAKLPILVKFMN